MMTDFDQGQERFYQTERGKLATVQWGRDDGFPIIAIHGWMDNAHSFLPLAQCMDLQRFRLIALDLPGHGKSDHRPAGDTYNLLEYALDIVRLMDALGYDKVFLLGHSLGGVISALVASAMSERISACVFLDALGPMANQESQTASQLGKALQYFLKPRQEAASVPDLSAAINARMGTFTKLSYASAELLMRRNLSEVDGRLRYRSDSRLRAPSLSRLTEGQIRDILRAIAAPVLLVVPEQGIVPGDAGNNPRLSCVQDLTVLKVPGMHHFHMETELPSLARAIVNYYANCLTTEATCLITETKCLTTEALNTKKEDNL